MRKSLPTNMRSRRTRKELEVDDMRNRTPSREIIHNDINGIAADEVGKAHTLLVNGSATDEPELSSRVVTNGHDRYVEQTHEIVLVSTSTTSHTVNLHTLIAQQLTYIIYDFDFYESAGKHEEPIQL